MLSYYRQTEKGKKHKQRHFFAASFALEIQADLLYNVIG